MVSARPNRYNRAMQPTIILNTDQQQVLSQIIDWLREEPSPYLAVGGYAGTGKTTLIAYLRKEMARSDKFKHKKVAFCCYTGKATAVLRQKLSEADALLKGDSCSTIHSLIYTPVVEEGHIAEWTRSPSIACDLVIVDEGSMVNEVIWRDLLSYRKPILVVGDHGQLPPVEGRFNLMESPALRLEHIVRQAEGNPIITLSKRVREGGSIPFGTLGSGLAKYSLQEYESRELFEGLVTGRSDDYLCICGLNRTRIHLNQSIRVARGIENSLPERGDRVICLKNNHAKFIYNGMLGAITFIEPLDEHWYEASIAMASGTTFEGKILKHQFNAATTFRGTGIGPAEGLSEKEFGDLFDFGYCLTVHKAQGSEAARVVLFEERMRAYDEEMWRRWLYTAVTRAREELYIFA